MTPVIDIQNVSFRYKERLALDNVSLQVRDEWFALIGPNGGGKSTLFRLLATLIPTQTGEIKIFGKPIAGSEAFIRAKTGVVFQTLSLDKKLTVEENLNYTGKLFGLKDVTPRVNELLGLLGLRDRKSEIVEKLSGGMKRRADIARALMHRPQLLLLDEPSAGLDPKVRQELVEFLKAIRKEGVTIVLVTHHLDEANECDRVGFMEGGKLVSITSPSEMTQKIEEMVTTLRADKPQALLQLFFENMGRALA